MRTSLKFLSRRTLSSISSPATTSPLEGIRILDLTRVLAGPFATMILSDLGAEVVKVEKPHIGDDTRSWGPPFMSNSENGRDTRESAYFLSVNRNKQSVCIDMKKAEGRSLLHRLADTSDVLVENYLPGKLDSLGLGYDELSLSNPGLIYCSITGFGSSGPYSSRGGYDVIAASMAGLLHVTGARDGEPAKVGVAMTDLATALYAHGAILAALLHRVQTGKGQWVECNLLSTQVSAMTHLAGNWLNCGVESNRWGTQHMSLVPYQTFPTRDGYLTVGCGNTPLFKEFCERIDRTDLAMEDKYQDNEGRVQHREELIPQIQEVMVTQTTKEWCARFQGAVFPYGPVNKMSDVFQDPQVKHSCLEQSVSHPTLGRVAMVGPAVTYSRADNKIRGSPPLLGEHTDRVLRDRLGLSHEEIIHLRKKGVVS